jgi:hypothetical protein
MTWIPIRQQFGPNQREHGLEGGCRRVDWEWREEKCPSLCDESEANGHEIVFLMVMVIECL